MKPKVFILGILFLMTLNPKAFAPTGDTLSNATVPAIQQAPPTQDSSGNYSCPVGVGQGCKWVAGPPECWWSSGMRVPASAEGGLGGGWTLGNPFMPPKCPARPLQPSPNIAATPGKFLRFECPLGYRCEWRSTSGVCINESGNSLCSTAPSTVASTPLANPKATTVSDKDSKLLLS